LGMDETIWGTCKEKKIHEGKMEPEAGQNLEDKKKEIQQ
jgi:hypothetical protein